VGCGLAVASDHILHSAFFICHSALILHFAIFILQFSMFPFGVNQGRPIPRVRSVVSCQLVVASVRILHFAIFILQFALFPSLLLVPASPRPPISPSPHLPSPNHPRRKPRKQSLLTPPGQFVLPDAKNDPSLRAKRVTNEPIP
jgi:hypothetical protein